MEENLYANNCPKLPWMLYLSDTDTEGKKSTLDAAYAQTWYDDLSTAKVDSRTTPFRLTQIMCTIGNSNRNIDTMVKLMDSGMGIARVDSTYYRPEDCTEVIGDIRKASDKYSKHLGRVYPLAIALDIGCMNIKTGRLREIDGDAIYLEEGRKLMITSEKEYEECVTKDVIYVNYEKFYELLQSGDLILIDHGRIQLSANGISELFVKCTVIKGGHLASEENVTLPNIPVDRQKFTEKDKDCILLGVDLRVDMLLISKANGPNVIKSVRDVLGAPGKSIMVVAKVNNSESLQQIDVLISMCDGIMIDRDNANTDLTQEKFFIAQKNIAAKCIKKGIPSMCIIKVSDCTTEGLTNSEIQDISSTVIDGVDCILLSKRMLNDGITWEEVYKLSKVCRECESKAYQRQSFNNITDIHFPMEPVYTIAVSAVEASLKCTAAAIILASTSGRSAKIVSKFRPRCPIIAITRCGHVARQLHVFRGVYAMLHIRLPNKDWQLEMEKRLQMGITLGKVLGFILPGDTLILVNNTREGSGFTNGMKIVYASEYDCKIPAPVIING